MKPESSARIVVVSFVLGLGALAAAPALAEDWPSWRGPMGDGKSREEGLPERWGKDGQGIAWRLALPGPAGSSPIVTRDRIFLTSAAGEDLVLLCVSAKGKELWRRTLGTGNKDFRGDEGNLAAPSPSTDGKHVWTLIGNGRLSCHDLDGKLVWETDLRERYGEYDHWFGYASTPLLEGGALYLMCIRMEDPYILALDKATGKELWRRPRPSAAEHESRHSYASPVLYRGDGEPLLLIHGADFASAHRLSDGEEVWRCGEGVLNPRGNYNKTLRFIASPATAPGLVVLPSAKGNPVLGVKPDGKGDVTGTHVAWKRPRDTTDVPTPVIHDGLVYNLRENGVLICIDAKSGEEVYLQRLHQTRQRSSPIYADGKLYIADRDGVVHVVKAGRAFERIAQNEMGEPIASTPAISGGRIYLRTFDALYAVAGAKEAEASSD